MKKKIIILLASLLLTGCTYHSSFNLQDGLNDALAAAQNASVFQPNMNKKYYSYYLYPYIGRHKSTMSSNIFNYRGTQFVMNLNISSLINEKYYDSTTDQVFSLKQPAASAAGEYNDYQDVLHAYQVSVYEQDGYYITVFSSDTIEFYSVSDALKTCLLVKEMLKMARSVKVNQSEVIAAYSYSETIDYQNEKIELFKSVAPESGRIEELFEDYSEDSDQEEKNENGPKQIVTDDQDAEE